MLEAIIVKVRAVRDTIFCPAVIGGKGCIIIAPLYVEWVVMGVIVLVSVDILEAFSVECEICCLLKHRHR